MQFTEEDVVLFQERMLAIQEILSDLSEMFEKEVKEVKEEQNTKKDISQIKGDIEITKKPSQLSLDTLGFGSFDIPL